MRNPQRAKSALLASAKHLLVSTAVALVVAALVFTLWYPTPYSELAGGYALFLLLISVDVAVGPLLTLIVFSPHKAKQELRRDIGLILLIQFTALIYGLYSIMQARPVYLAFEGDRYRVVSVPDIDLSNLAQATPSFRQLSLTGPKLVGVRLAQPDDPEYRQSVIDSVAGQHPAFRPRRWVDYDSQRQQVIARAHPLVELQQRYPKRAALFEKAINESGLPLGALGFLPLLAEKQSDWVVVVGIHDGLPKTFLPIDGWQ